MDQRDNAINDLSKLMDIRVVTDPSNQTNIFTNSGIQLVGQGLSSSFTALSVPLRYSTSVSTCCVIGTAAMVLAPAGSPSGRRA